MRLNCKLLVLRLNYDSNATANFFVSVVIPSGNFNVTTICSSLSPRLEFHQFKSYCIVIGSFHLHYAKLNACEYCSAQSLKHSISCIRDMTSILPLQFLLLSYIKSLMFFFWSFSLISTSFLSRALYATKIICKFKWSTLDREILI